MAKKGVWKSLGEAFVSVFEVLGASAFKKIGDETEELLEKVEKHTLILEEKVARRLGTALVVTLGWLLLLASLFFYLTEQAGLSRSRVLLLLGLLLLILGFWLKYVNLKNEVDHG